MKTLVFTLLLVLFASNTYASLLVTPLRVAFDKRDRTAEVVLVNTSTSTKSYKVDWVNQAQGQGGGYLPLNEDELEAFPRADKYIRFSPRRVTLQPGESQKVKLMVRRGADMNLAEYRSHLKFTALPDQTTSNVERQGPATGVNIKLNVLLSYSIPVILRTESPSAEVHVAKLGLMQRDEDGKNVLNIDLVKPSDNSVYGSFTVLHTLNGEQKEVGKLNGVNMFAERNTMSSRIVLHQNIDPSQGELEVVFKGKQEFADTVFDEAKLVLN